MTRLPRELDLLQGARGLCDRANMGDEGRRGGRGVGLTTSTGGRGAWWLMLSIMLTLLPTPSRIPGNKCNTIRC